MWDEETLRKQTECLSITPPSLHPPSPLLLLFLLLAPLFTLPSPIRGSCGPLTSPVPGPIRRRDARSVASEPPASFSPNLSCLISLMMDFKSDGRSRNSVELMQAPRRARARTLGAEARAPGMSPVRPAAPQNLRSSLERVLHNFPPEKWSK